jgi:hypothetical protein
VTTALPSRGGDALWSFWLARALSNGCCYSRANVRDESEADMTETAVLQTTARATFADDSPLSGRTLFRIVSRKPVIPA